ncbi:MAG TPA: hypothetical protein V6C84_00160 [Coleofasciculaceae cyanobacterium]|jgi:hypothetical protein
MAQRLKRWESPRSEGRNNKGRGGSARQRQRQKQMRMLKQKLKQQDGAESEQGKRGEKQACFFPLFFWKLALCKFLIYSFTPTPFLRYNT